MQNSSGLTQDQQMKLDLGYKPYTLEPYNYEHYRNINPNLTVKMYEYLRGIRSLWRVRCGKHCKIKWTDEELLPVWWLDIKENNNQAYLKYNPNDSNSK